MEPPNTIYGQFLNDVYNSHGFKVDFKSRTMTTRNMTYIINGKWNQKFILYSGHEERSIESAIEALYKSYKYSVPSKESEKYKSKYFKAMSVDELTDFDLITGERRDITQAALEGFILCAVLSGDLVWNENKYGKWFYQGNDKDLIILREWVESNYK